MILLLLLLCLFYMGSLFDRSLLFCIMFGQMICRTKRVITRPLLFIYLPNPSISSQQTVPEPLFLPYSMIQSTIPANAYTSALWEAVVNNNPLKYKKLNKIDQKTTRPLFCSLFYTIQFKSRSSIYQIIIINMNPN